MLTESNLINSLNLDNSDTLFLLGAGCSIESDCPSSQKLIDIFKRKIYFTENHIPYSENASINDEQLNKLLGEHFNKEVDNEYSYYFEKCYPNPIDRNGFIKNQFLNKNPSTGYLCFASYVINSKIKYIATTNFDDLINKAILKLDSNYDVVKTTDSLDPLLNYQTNIIKLHGDFNYDLTRNTKSELDSLGDDLIHKLGRINVRKIIVSGYSGQDKSVMSFLKQYLQKNKNCVLYWCILDDKNIRNKEPIDELLSINSNSNYVMIGGFDSLFCNHYKTYGPKNDYIDKIEKKNCYVDFKSPLNRKEKFHSNTHTISSYPFIWTIKFFNCDNEKIKELNEQNNSYDITPFNKNLYILGNKDKALPDLGYNGEVNYINLADLDIPIRVKENIIKSLVLKASFLKGCKIFKNNIYDNDNNPCEGLNITIDRFKNELCLLDSPNYFYLKEEITANEKYQINMLKSKLYLDKNHEMLNDLENRLLNDFVFDLYGSKVEFNGYPLTTDDNCMEYSIIEEPKMKINNNISINQIKLLNSYGPCECRYSKSKIKVGIICPNKSKNVLNKFLNVLINGNASYFSSNNIVGTFPGFNKLFKKEIEFIYFDTAFEADVFVKSGINKTIQSYERASKSLYEKGVDLVLIYFSKDMHSLKENGKLDFHDLLKLDCLNKYKTQFLEESTIESRDNINKILFSLSTAIYTKTIGMPWAPAKIDKNILYLGMSFGITNEGVTVGCSQLFDGAGRGLQLIVSKVSDKGRKNQYLNESEAYNLGKKIRATYYKSSKIEDIKNIVIHRSSPFKDEEIKGFARAFEGLDDFTLLQIIDNNKFNCYPFINEHVGRYPLLRGSAIKDSSRSFYLWTDGTIRDDDVIPNHNYRNNTRGMGSPIKVVIYHGKQSIEQISNDILFLTKMDFNSAGNLHSRLPVTIKYSQLVCDLMKQGSTKEDEINFEYIM